MAENRGPDVILAGFGSSDALQLTVEAQQVAVRAGRILALDLPPRLKALLERQGVEVTDLASLYRPGAFAEAYAAIAETVLARAAADPPALFLSQGSPLLMNAVTRYLMVEAKKRGLAVRTYPAVSPIDAVVAELGVDVGLSGLQTLSARGFLAKPGLVNVRMPLLLLQVAGVTGGDVSAEAFGPLTLALAEIYPQSQPLTLLNMPGDGRVTRATVTVARFGELISHIDTSSSLFIDVARQPAPATTS